MASSGPLLLTAIEKVTVSPSAGIADPLVSVLTVTKSANPAATPLLFPSEPSSESLRGFVSTSSALTLASLVNVPGPLMVPVTVIVTSFAGEPTGIEAIVQGKAVHPPPVTEVIVIFEGVSVITTLFAVSAPKLLTTISQETVSPV